MMINTVYERAYSVTTAIVNKIIMFIECWYVLYILSYATLFLCLFALQVSGLVSQEIDFYNNSVENYLTHKVLSMQC